jgi:hypothetical protein
MAATKQISIEDLCSILQNCGDWNDFLKFGECLFGLGYHLVFVGVWFMWNNIVQELYSH